MKKSKIKIKFKIKHKVLRHALENCDLSLGTIKSYLKHNGLSGLSNFVNNKDNWVGQFRPEILKENYMDTVDTKQEDVSTTTSAKKVAKKTTKKKAVKKVAKKKAVKKVAKKKATKKN